MPLDKCCGDTFITWPEVNRIFEAAALCPEGPNEYKHDVFGYAFRNPTTFLDVFRFAGYPLGVQMTDGLREKTKVTLAIAHGAVESPNWWAGCSTKPTHGTHLYGQFVYCPIDAVTTKIGDKRIPLGLGDSFPTEKERQGEGAHTYRLVPRVEQVRAPRQRRRPIYGDRYLPSVHMAQVLTSNAVASRRHETAISGCLMPTPESAALTEAKMQNFPIIRIHVTLSSGRP
jgi:hypothetical protein